MHNLFCVPYVIKKNIFFILLLFINKSYAIDNLNHNNFNLTENELITEVIASNIGINLINTSFWFGSCFLVEKFTSLINDIKKKEYEYIGDDDRIDTKKLLINSALLNLAEIFSLGNSYAILPNSYILLTIRIVGFLGVFKFSITKDKTKQEIFNRIISLILLENIVTIIPNILFAYYDVNHLINHYSIINAAGIAISTTSSLLVSIYAYDLVFNQTNSRIKSLAFFILTELIVGFVSSNITGAIVEHNTNGSKRSIWTYQMLGYCIFTIINSMSIISCFPKIKGYIPYLYSCLISAYGFGTVLFTLITLETKILKSDFFWHDASTNTLGVLSFISTAAALFFTPILSSIITYNYGDKIIKKLYVSNKNFPLIALNTVTPLCVSLISAGVMSFYYNIPFKKTLLYLNQTLLKKFYSITQYTKLILKI